MVQEGIGSSPHHYEVVFEDDEVAVISETDISLPNIQETREFEAEGDSLSPGMIVETGDRHWFGKIKEVDDVLGIYDVAFFHYPGKEDVHPYQLNKIERTHLYPQTRVYVQRDGHWHVGRIMTKGKGKRLFYTVRFPGKKDEDILEEDLYVRSLSAGLAPTVLLSNHGLEAQFLHDVRRRFVRRVTRLRNLSRGLTGMLSSSVELVEHQIMAARQVLSDPVQRYILADEVGLGKTIEAGFIIRQVLIDSPRCSVVILVPSALLEQWDDELCTKFRVEQFATPPMVLTYDQISELDGLDIELLVVDEAHNLFRPEGCSDELIQAALKARGLLLLTATPIIGHEETFLNMLRVLDPDIYAHTDLGAFQIKAKLRKEFGALARMLDNAERISPIALIKAKKLLADDARGKELVEAIVQANDADGGDLPGAIRALHRHIIEHCRIYHRLIRNRRKDIEGGLFLPRSAMDGQKHVKTFSMGGGEAFEAIELFEEWRQAAHETLNELSDEAGNKFLEEMALDCAELFEAVGGGNFGSCLHDLIRKDRPGGCVRGAEAIADAATDRDEEQALRDLKQAVEHMLMLPNEAGTEFVRINSAVVFISDPGLAEDLMDRYDPPANLKLTFLNRQQEEGQNHQHAQAIIHLDIPLDPVRMEQRIGRLDRFSQSATTLVHVCGVPGKLTPGNPWAAWFNVLASGYRIFNEPISDVQFLLEKERTSLAKILLLQGVAGVVTYNVELPERLRIERGSLDDQYALDKLVSSDEDSLSWFEELEDGDYEEEETARDLEAWMCQALKLNADREQGGVTYSWNRYDTLIPAYPWERYIGVGLGRPATYERVKATKHARFDLVRVGHPLVDAMEQFCRWDSRGVSFATWRQSLTHDFESPLPILKLDFLIEGDLHEFENDFSQIQKLAIARRRSDSLLPPWNNTVYLYLDATLVSDPTLLELLQLSYGDKTATKVVDVNLKNRPDVLNQVVDFDFLASLLPLVKNTASCFLRDSETYVRKMRACERVAREDFENRTLRLRMQYEHTDLTDKQRKSRLLESLIFEEAITKAVLEPQIRLESIGLFILAATPPKSN